MKPQSSRTRRREFLPAHRVLHERTEREACRVAEMERLAWLAARDRCLQLEKIRRNAKRRLAELSRGSPEKFAGERALAQAALREVARCEPHESAAYTILSFASRYDRLRYLRGSDAEREALVRETLARGRFQEILL